MKNKLKLSVAALLLSGFVFVSCEDDINKNSGGGDEEIKVESVEWKSDLKSGIEWELGNNSLNVANRMDILPANATNQKQTFSSSNTDVASVSEFGQVTTKALGETTITVEVDGQSAGFKLTVVEEKEVPVVHVTGISIPDKNVSVGAGSTKNLAALFTVLPANAANKSVTYESSDQSVVTVTTAGVITGVKAGTAKVSVTSNDVPAVSGEFDITVTTFYGDYEPRSAWTVENMHPALFGGEAAAIIEGMFDNNTSTWLSFVKPGQQHSGSGHPPVANPALASGGYISFTVDMKAEQTVNYFRINWRDKTNSGMRFAKFETISGSNDNEEFITIASNVEITNAGTLAEILSPNVLIQESTYRYIKFYVGTADCFFSLTTNKTVSIAELYLGRAE